MTKSPFEKWLFFKETKKDGHPTAKLESNHHIAAGGQFGSKHLLLVWWFLRQKNVQQCQVLSVLTTPNKSLF